MNDRSKSDLLFEEDEEFMDALEEAVEKLSWITREGGIYNLISYDILNTEE